MFSEPAYNIEQFGLRQGMKVADLGSGAGFYSVAAAKVVGENGKVYSVDIQKELLERVVEEAAQANIQNIEIVWGDIEKHQGTRLRDQSMDAVIIANTLFQVEDRESFLNEALRILIKGGRALVIDWSESFGGIGPQKENIVSAEEARALMEQHHFVFDKNIQAGQHHYGMIFFKR